MTPALLRLVAGRGHSVFAGELSLNLIAQRSSSRSAGNEDDLISAVWHERGAWREIAWPCSTDPGRKYLAAPINPAGTAILAPGQYRGSHERGLHHGRPALVQVAPVTVHRDLDRDAVLEPGPSDTGLFGVNIHDDAGAGAEASAGCVVLPLEAMRELLEVVDRSTARWGPRVTLTLVEL